MQADALYPRGIDPHSPPTNPMRSFINAKIVRGLIGLTGFSITGLSLAILATGLATELTGPTTDLAGAIGASVCMLFTSTIGAVLVWFGWVGIFGDEPTDSDVELEILELAARTDGAISIARVAANTDLSLEQSEDILEDLAKKGLARLDLDDEGNRIFVFSGLEETLLDDDDGDQPHNALQQKVAEERARRKS